MHLDEDAVEEDFQVLPGPAHLFQLYATHLRCDSEDPNGSSGGELDLETGVWTDPQPFPYHFRSALAFARPGLPRLLVKVFLESLDSLNMFFTAVTPGAL